MLTRLSTKHLIHRRRFNQKGDEQQHVLTNSTDLAYQNDINALKLDLT